jgi:hypothetical protein
MKPLLLIALNKKQIKQKYESIQVKPEKTNARLKTKLSNKRKDDAEKRITELNNELEELNN